jgi:hypothetical protein
MTAAKEAKAIPATTKKICRESRPVIRIAMGVAIAGFPYCSNRVLSDFRGSVDRRRRGPSVLYRVGHERRIKLH